MGISDKGFVSLVKGRGRVSNRRWIGIGWSWGGWKFGTKTKEVSKHGIFIIVEVVGKDEINSGGWG